VKTVNNLPHGDYDYYGTPFHCPRCGGENLHHGTVTVFNRREDADRTHVTTVAGEDHVEIKSISSDDCDNPSSRRDGMRIAFNCEECGDGLYLFLLQHKGTTYLHWGFMPADPLYFDRLYPPSDTF